MNQLEATRKKINEIDREMAKLFAARMKAVEQVARYKKEVGLPVLDSGREEEVVRRNAALIDDEALKSYYVNFLQYNMTLSRRYQHRLLEGMRVAYSGVPGAFAEAAAKRIFPDAAPVPCADFKAAYDAVVAGECDCAVLPLENSYNGDVSQVMDLAFFGDLYINGIYEMEIVQNLIALPGTALHEIREVVSHPQALGQCAGYIREHGWAMAEYSNTAAAAKAVAEGKDRTRAAIANEEAAALYGLTVLERNIQGSSTNTTRFAVFSRVASPKPRHDPYFVMAFSVKNEAGGLSRAVSAIGEAGINLHALKSRPTKALIWDYYFFAEGEGDMESPAGQKMLAALRERCNDIKVLGYFERTR